jgi:large repetitive protein
VTSTDSETVPTVQTPSLGMVKSGTPSAYAAVGDTLGYTFTVSNTGNTTIAGPVSINDPLIQPPFTCAVGPLAPAATASCTASYIVTQADIDAGSVTNTARAFTGPVGSPTLQSAPSSATAFAQQAPALTVAKSTTQTAASDFTLGNTITYSYLVTNSGNVSIPAPVSIADNYATTSCPAGGLAPGATLTCTGTYVVTVNDLALGSLTNNATANATFNGNPVVSNTGSVTIPGGASPALTVTKVPAGGPITGVGQVLTYTYTVINTGDAAFTSDVSIIDDKVVGPILCHDSQGGTAPLSPVATGPLPTSATCTATYTTVQADVDAGSVTNTAFAQGIYAPLSPNPQTVQGPAVTATVGATPSPALNVAKAVTGGPNPAAAGDVLTYTVTTTNSGNQTVSVITVTDPLIPALTCMIGGNPAPANIVLAPAQVLLCTGTYTVTQADIDAQTLGNTATVTGVSPQGTPVSVTGGTTHPVAPAAPVVSVVKSVISPTTNPVYSSVGEQIVYGVAVTNGGNTTLTTVTVADPLVPTQTCTAGPLAPGATDSTCTFTYTVTQTDIDAGSIANTATATAQPATPVAPTVTGSGSVTAAGPVAAPSFLVAKTADVAAISLANQTVTYTYVVTNTSNVTIRGVPSVTDNRIGTFSCGTAPLAPGAQTQCTATYTVTQPDLNAGGVTNVATAQAPAVPAGGGFPASPAVPPSVPVSLTLPTASAPGLTLVKSVVSQTALFPTIWQTTFQIVATNTGNLSLTALSLQDDLAAFAAPGAVLAAPTYPVSVTLTGFTDSQGASTASLNTGYDGTTDISLLAPGASLDPGRSGQLLITFTYTTTAATNLNTNTVTGTSPTLTGPVSATTAANVIDSDGDGIPDVTESCTADRDGDGVCDAQDYDPTGYFYCEDDGAILIGGSISVSGPAGTQTGIGTSNSITIVADGSTGAYQFFVTAPGIYTLTPTYPSSGAPSTTRVPTSVPVDLTTFLPTDPVAFGSTEFGSTGVLADFTAAANTPSHLVFDIQAGDPHVIGNNFALTGCAGVAPITASKTASVGSARAGDAVTFTMTFVNGTSASGNNSTFVDLLPPGLVYTPGTATVNGVLTEPVIAGNRLSWSSYNLTPGLTFTVVLTTRVLGTATFGTLTNTGFVEDTFGNRVSNVATASVRIEPEHVFDCSDVIGKVFDDLNMNGYQDQGEPGLPDVRVVTIRGVRITSDEYGRYHVPCAELPADIGSNFTLKLVTR